MPAQRSPYQVRGDDGADAGLTTWRGVAQASELLLQVERGLDGLAVAGDDTSPFRLYVAGW